MDRKSVAAANLGPEVPGSQQLELTLRLGPTAAQAKELKHLLADQTTPGSPRYHHWLNPQQFASRFGWSPDERDALTTWLSSRGLTVDAEHSTSFRLALHGSAAQVQSTFRTSLRQVTLEDGAIATTNTGDASLPAIFTQHTLSLSGLDTLPQPLAGRLLSPSLAGTGPTHVAAEKATAGSPATPVATLDQMLRALEDAVAENSSSVLVLDSFVCPSETTAADRAAVHLALEQAEAQGITVLVSGSCAPSRTESTEAASESTEAASNAVFPSALAEVAAVLTRPDRQITTAVTGSEARPAWQSADGLPSNSLREAPDFRVTSLDTLESTVLQLVKETGGRIGNLSPTLYALAKSPGLFNRSGESPSTADTQEWTALTGLGTLNLEALLRLYPRGLVSTSISLVSSAYSVHYGENFTLTATVSPSSYGTTNPTGTVVFSDASQGILGSAVINSGGVATLTLGSLPAGTYSVTATYSGDSAYATSTNVQAVGIYVAIVTAKLSAVLSPVSKVPYGATATVTATVALPYANATPDGTVTAQVQGITSASYTAILSPNSGGNTATANIVVSVPPAGTYNLEVTCQGNANYQCQTPVTLPFTTIKGYTNTTVSASPQAPQAGQPVILTALIADAGNGTGTYTFSGSISFFDSGKLIATTPVATNQGTTTTMLSGNRTHNITATYTGDTNWNASTSNGVAVTPTILPDSLSISSNASNGVSLSGVNIIFSSTAVSTITYGAGPTGNVTFYDTFNGSVVALGNPSPLVANGPIAAVATLHTTGLLPGAHHIYAQYAGDSNYASATSAALEIIISDFGVTMTPSTLTIDQGKTQQVSVLVNGSGYTGAISLGCTPPPSSETTCSFSPASVSGGGTASLTITTTASATALIRSTESGFSLWSAASGVSLACLSVWLVPRRSRRLPALFALILISSVGLGATGCGLGIRTVNGGGFTGSGSSGTSTSGTNTDSGSPLGTQTFTITAAGADDNGNTVRHTYKYQVTIQ